MIGLRQNISLQQKMAPQLIQSLRLLQMPTLELEQLIQQELEMNPLLELNEEVEQDQEEEKEPEEETPEAEADTARALAVWRAEYEKLLNEIAVQIDAEELGVSLDVELKALRTAKGKEEAVKQEAAAEWKILLAVHEETHLPDIANEDREIITG